MPLDFWSQKSSLPARHPEIYKRLSTRVVRDVDIVTSKDQSRKTEITYINEPVLNTSTGSAQKIYIVDNTAASGGDGSNAMPFNALADAQAAADAHDVIYVRAGDGTSNGMTAGLTLSKTGQRLIGAGAGLWYDPETMHVPGINIPVRIEAAAPRQL